jgi:hypothetical protein
MRVLASRWFRALAIFALLLVLLVLNINQIVVFVDKRYFEPTYRGCVTVVGWIAEDVSQLERQIVCNITMVRIAADAERALASKSNDEQNSSG